MQTTLPGIAKPKAGPRLDRFVGVALPLPFMQPMTYRVPEGWPEVPRGSRVEAPFGNRRVTGVVVDPAAKAKEVLRLKSLTDILDDEPLVTERLL